MKKVYKVVRMELIPPDQKIGLDYIVYEPSIEQVNLVKEKFHQMAETQHLPKDIAEMLEGLADVLPQPGTLSQMSYMWEGRIVLSVKDVEELGIRVGSLLSVEVGLFKEDG